MAKTFQDILDAIPKYAKFIVAILGALLAAGTIAAGGVDIIPDNIATYITFGILFIQAFLVKQIANKPNDTTIKAVLNELPVADVDETTSPVTKDAYLVSPPENYRN